MEKPTNFLYREDVEEYVLKKKSSSLLRGVCVGMLASLSLMITVTAILLRLGLISIEPGAPGGGSSLADKIYNKLVAIEDDLSAFYFDDVNDDEVIDAICDAYLGAYGDKYTVYYNKDEYKKLWQENNGYFVGIGVLVSKNDDGSIKIERVYPDSPGEKAGLREGDAIMTVDGEGVAQRELDAVVSQIRGEAGTTVSLAVRRRGTERVETLDIVRDRVDYVMVSSKMIQGDIGYLLISQFSEVTCRQFKDQYEDLLNQGAKGIIIDVRDNPGGLLSSVCDVCDMLVPDGTIVYTEDKEGRRTVYKGKNKEMIEVPLAVLINGGSASAAEIFAGCIQDYGVGTLVGTTTFGKGIVQTIIGLSDGSGMKYTTSKYFTPKGQDIHGNGVKPDVELVFDADRVDWSKEVFTEEDDNQLMKAIEVIRGKY